MSSPHDSSSPGRERNWTPYEDNPPRSLERFRYAAVPHLLSKRHFFLPRINLVGFTIIELLVAFAILAGITALGLVQRTAEAEASGNVAQILWIPLFLLICYRSVIAYAFGISFERSMFWHPFLAVLATGYGIWHGIASMYWAEFDDDDPVRGFDAFRSGEYKFEFITGAIASAIMFLILITSIHPIRRRVRRIWLWSHHILPTAAVIVCIIHGAAAVLAGVAIYLADRLFGYIYQAWFQYRSMGSQGMARVLPSGIVRLSFPRKLDFKPGQYMSIQVPSVSIFEFHTFSISSMPSDDELVFLIQREGYWTKKLKRRVAAKTGSSQDPILAVPMQARLHGPLGSVALDWQSECSYDAFILIAGGIGITPLMPFYRHLAQQKVRGRNVRRARLIWCIRKQQLFEDCVNSQLEAKTHDSWGSTDDLGRRGDVMPTGFDTEVFLTGKDDLSPDKNFRNGHDSERALGSLVWHKGRPDLNAVLSDFGECVAGEGGSRVAVLACGPGDLTASVCNEARAVSSSGLQFDVHLEHFY